MTASDGTGRVVSTCRIEGDRCIIRYDREYWERHVDQDGRRSNKFKIWSYRHGTRVNGLVLDIGELERPEAATDRGAGGAGRVLPGAGIDGLHGSQAGLFDPGAPAGRERRE